jgi:hypothetical protein
MTDIVNKHGATSLDNNLSLGCQLAFAQSAPGIMCTQAAPPMPRRTSYTLSNSIPALSTNLDDFIFPLPVGVTPDSNSNIHVFIKNNTNNVETQVLPNKFTFYDLDVAGQPTTSQFIFDNALAPSGNSFSYSVNKDAEALTTGLDGYMTENLALGYTHGIFTSSIIFDASYLGKTLKIIDTVNVANKGSFLIDAVSGGALYIHTTQFADFTSTGAGSPTEGNETFELFNPATGLVVVSGNATDGVLVDSAGTATATLTSATINFSTFSGILNLQLTIAGSNYNNGTYDIIANGSPNTITIRKRFFAETGMRYEVIDSGLMSQFIVINHNVVPNGYGLRVTIVDARDAKFFDAGWINALASLEPQEIDVLVALPKQTISVIFQNALAHCQVMSNLKNKKERVLFLGAINGLTPDNITGAKLAAVEDIGVLEGIQGETLSDILAGRTEDIANYSVSNAFGNTYRAVYFYPDQIICQVGSDNVLIDGFYMAAAGAGWVSATNNVAMPMTNKILSGFTILRNKQFSPTVLEQLGLAGVTILQPVQGGGRIKWGITTTQSGFVEEQEISIIFIRDRIAKSLRTGFGAFIGLPDSDDLGSMLTARANALLDSFKGSLITDAQDLAVIRDPVNPTKWDISVRVAPIYPCNQIFISVSVGLL